MRRYLHHLIATFLLVVSAATPSMAADGQTTVKVALLDMSSLMPLGATGYGMMGPGMMGPGWWQGQGQGTAGPGMGNMGPWWGPGMGNMGPWWGQGQGTTNPGIMGYGMMGGMMSIRVDQPTVKAGAVAFDVTNWSRSVLHEMLVVAVDNPTAPLPYDYPQARVPEDQVKVLGEAADLQPNTSKTFELTLKPGSYLLICNLPGHYAAGMVAPLSVTP